ncbi:hypothetical protein AWC22_27855 [Mycobacterium riyadhense]|uniref:Uncharacterized protein n=1 Tax=Mycobacterium riyadhense TaxID=486698 RepID=A0A1X2BUL5_9MYCO|nr:hypothetical protein AWC22_27855 [Mycobacterium riyadhense]VTP01521.1 hypothetical protein BIN_B_04051 [Mycobacterium riyadhense]
MVLARARLPKEASGHTSANHTDPVNGEMLIAIAGRVAPAVVSEMPGVQRLSWSTEDVAQQLNAIRDLNAPRVFPAVPDGHADHIRYSFESAAWARRESVHHV